MTKLRLTLKMVLVTFCFWSFSGSSNAEYYRNGLSEGEAVLLGALAGVVVVHAINDHDRRPAHVYRHDYHTYTQVSHNYRGCGHKHHHGNHGHGRHGHRQGHGNQHGGDDYYNADQFHKSRDFGTYRNYPNLYKHEGRQSRHRVIYQESGYRGRDSRSHF